MKIAERDPNKFIFSEDPGNRVMLPKNYMFDQHLKILRVLGYPSDYTLYSWKHSGVVWHYLAGID
jgi:hypothetical protein